MRGLILLLAFIGILSSTLSLIHLPTSSILRSNRYQYALHMSSIDGTTATEVFQLYAGNLPFNVDRTRLADIVTERLGSESSKVKGVRIATDKITGKSRGFAFIDFDDQACAEDALKLLGGLEIEGREIKVDVNGLKSVKNNGMSGEKRGTDRRSSSDRGDRGDRVVRQARAPQENSVFVGNLDDNITDDDLMNACIEVFGPDVQVSIRIGRDKFSGAAKGYAHIDYATAEEAQRAINDMNGKDINGRFITVAPAQRKEDRPVRPRTDSFMDGSRDSRGPRRDNSAGRNSVFIGNLPWEVTNELVEDMVNDILGPGLYSAVRLATDKETGRTRGFGHVDFKDKETAERAVVEFNGLEVMGRQLRADHATARSSSPGSEQMRNDRG